jgi:hypothetical protein
MTEQTYTLQDDYELAKMLFGYSEDLYKFDIQVQLGQFHKCLSEPSPQSDYEVLVALRARQHGTDTDIWLWPQVQPVLMQIWGERDGHYQALYYRPGDYAKAAYTTLQALKTPSHDGEGVQQL